MKYLRGRHSIYKLLSIVLLTGLLLSGGGSNAVPSDLIVIPITGSTNPSLVSFSCGWQPTIVGAGCWGALQAVGNYSFQRVTSPVRYGAYAVRIEVRPGDPLVSNGQRAEVLRPTDGSGDDSNLRESELSGTKYYAFSVLLPTDWSTAGGSDGYWATVLQLHGPDALNVSPAFAFETRGFGTGGGQNYAVQLCTGDILRAGGCYNWVNLTDGSLNLGHWTDFVLGITYAKDASGSVNIWRRNEGQVQFIKVVSINNTPTLQYSSAVSGGAVAPHYWKMGLYRNASSPLTNVLYLGGFTRAESLDAAVGALDVPSLQISGNAGVAGATLSYTDGGAKTAASAADGSYSFSVSPNWTGTVTPSKAGYIFSPTSRTYTNVTAAQTNQDYSLPEVWSTKPWYGSVSITSDKSVVAVARPHIGAEVTSYDGFASGSLISYLPMLFKNAFGGAYDSAFYVQNLDSNPAHTAHVAIDYYDSAGAHTCGPIADTIAPLSSKGYWVPSECPPVGWVGGAVVTSSDYPIVTVGRPHVGAEVMTYDGFASGSTTVYLPMLFKNAFGGLYDSAFYVQDVDGANAAHIQIDYYDTGGNHTCGPISSIISPRSSRGYWVPSECPPVGWVGGVVITSDHDIVAVGRPHIGSQVTSYDGFSGGGTSSYVPMLFKNAVGGSYDSALYVQNVDPGSAAHITVNYYDSAGNLSCTRPIDTIQPLSSLGIWVPNEGCLPVGWQGSAVITSDHPIVALGRPHVGAQVTTYDGLTGGTTTMNLPMLFKNMWGSYNAAFYVQNTDPSGPASVTLKFYDVDGKLSCTRTDTIPAFATQGYWVPSVTCSP